MSGASKRLHEEGSHAMASKHPDGRLAKVARTEASDADKRSPLPQMNRLSSSSNDSYLEHYVTSDNRLEPRNSKDERDVKVENRVPKAETRELYPESKIDTQSTRGEKDVRLESRGSDNKDMKHDRDATDFKGEVKMGKDTHAAGNTHLNWKDVKEHHWPKRYPDLSGDALDPWLVSQSSRGTNEIGKEASATEERNPVEAYEAVGENKVDAKGDDKLKDKERKRKDEKHRDWGERDKERSDRHNNVPQLGYNSSERRESMREERELDKRERERKDFLKDKEQQPKERESDHVKRDTSNGIEKEDSRIEKDPTNGSVKMPEQEGSTLEQKRQKEYDNWKAVDRDAKDRRKERDVDMEGDRQEKRSRFYDKELDESCTEGDGGVDREREVFGSGVQQRKRMLRPRGSPQVASREPRFRSRVADNDGSQGQQSIILDSATCMEIGKPEVSTVVYKAGECMQELLKLWKQFEASQDSKNDESSHAGPTLEIRVPAEYVTATNHQVRGGQLWGTDIYTDDSDLVAVLMHTGYCRPTSTPPPPAIQELRATIRVLPPQDSYTSTLRNNVRSRAWGAAIGCSFCVERCCIVKKGGGTIDLEPCLTHTSVLEPTLAPMAVERTMTTRSAASNALRQQRFVREVTIQYNLCNEPWIKYSISVVADKGLKKPLYTSARLKKGEVLYLETHTNRYELCFNGEKMVSTANVSQSQETETHKLRSHNAHVQNGERNVTDRDTTAIDVFRWSRCKKPLPQKVMCSVGIPLPLEHLEVLEENLDWEDIQWSQTGVWIAGKEYVLARVHFLSPN